MSKSTFYELLMTLCFLLACFVLGHINVYFGVVYVLVTTQWRCGVMAADARRQEEEEGKVNSKP